MKQDKNIPLRSICFLLLIFAVNTGYSQEEQTTGQYPSANYQKYIIPKTDMDIWVNTDGHVQGTGTVSQPMVTLEKAIDLIKKTQGKSITIHLSGTIPYLLEKAITISDIHGTKEKPIIICRDSKDTTRPSFMGAKRLTNWTRLSQSEYYQKASPAEREKFQKEVISKIWICPLSEYGKNQSEDAVALGVRPELFVDGLPQNLARWPNEGFIQAGEVFGTEKAVGYNGQGFKQGIFEYQNERQNKWGKEADPRLFGYWFYDWAESYACIDKVDIQNHRICIKPPFHEYGYRKGFRYYGINLLCELDTPGEYYIDRTNNMIFWYPRQEDISKQNIVLTTFASPYMFVIQNCSHIILSGLDFQYGRSNAIQINGGDNCLIMDCSFYGFGNDAVHIYGGNNNGIACSQMECLGAGGIKISGGNRKTLTSCNNFIENCHVKFFSRLKRTYSPAVSMTGCGIRAAHNLFEESSSSAISIGTNDCLIEYNIVRNVVKESDDQGGIDIWYNPTFLGNVVRYNYWGDIIGGTVCGAAGIRLDDIISGFHIYGNIFERCGAVHFGAIQIHGGKDNIIEDNLFFNCFMAVSFSRWGDRYVRAISGKPESLSKVSLYDKMYKEVDIRNEIWQKRYPALKRIDKDPDVNTVKNNLVINCDSLFHNDGGVQITANNVVLKENNASLKSILDSNLFERYGVKKMNFEQMGNYPYHIEFTK